MAAVRWFQVRSGRADVKLPVFFRIASWPAVAGGDSFGLRRNGMAPWWMLHARVVLAAAGAAARGPGARTLRYPITAPSTRSACP
jgi:hypothetical protein